MPTGATRGIPAVSAPSQSRHRRAVVDEEEVPLVGGNTIEGLVRVDGTIRRSPQGARRSVSPCPAGVPRVRESFLSRIDSRQPPPGPERCPGNDDSPAIRPSEQDHGKFRKSAALTYVRTPWRGSYETPETQDSALEIRSGLSRARAFGQTLHISEVRFGRDKECL